MPEANSASLDEPTAPYVPAFDTGAVAVEDPVAGPMLSGGELPEPMVIPAAPQAVSPGPQHVGRWAFLGVTAGVWLPAAAAGAGLFYWWFRSIDKTGPAFGVLVFLIAAMVAGVLTAQVRRRPLVAALSLVLMSAPMAAVAGAAGLYGGYVFGWVTP